MMVFSGSLHDHNCHVRATENARGHVTPNMPVGGKLSSQDH